MGGRTASQKGRRKVSLLAMMVSAMVHKSAVKTSVTTDGYLYCSAGFEMAQKSSHLERWTSSSRAPCPSRPSPNPILLTPGEPPSSPAEISAGRSPSFAGSSGGAPGPGRGTAKGFAI